MYEHLSGCLSSKLEEGFGPALPRTLLCDLNQSGHFLGLSVFICTCWTGLALALFPCGSWQS